MVYIIDHIPRSTPHNRRPGLLLKPETITIHNTANPSSSARNERNWLTNPSNDRTASFHIVVDEREVIECIPLSEVAWAGGDGTNGPGNRTSIHIEICESGDYAKTLDNAAQLVAKMLKERGWGVDRLRRHFDWSGKICPRLMYDNGRWTGWTAFNNMVRDKLRTVKGDDQIMEELKKQVAELKKNVDELTKKIPAPDWFVDEFGSADLNGLINDPKFTMEGWRTLTVALRALRY